MTITITDRQMASKTAVGWLLDVSKDKDDIIILIKLEDDTVIRVHTNNNRHHNNHDRSSFDCTQREDQQERT
jgi:hypothetical protein